MWLSMFFRSVQQRSIQYLKSKKEKQRWKMDTAPVKSSHGRRATVNRHRSTKIHLFHFKWFPFIIFIFGLAAIDLKNGIKCQIKNYTVLVRWGQIKGTNTCARRKKGRAQCKRNEDFENDFYKFSRSVWDEKHPFSVYKKSSKSTRHRSEQTQPYGSHFQSWSIVKDFIWIYIVLLCLCGHPKKSKARKERTESYSL